jgi:hypothetical protein
MRRQDHSLYGTIQLTPKYCGVRGAVTRDCTLRLPAGAWVYMSDMAIFHRFHPPLHGAAQRT